jgi:hypothetical protein
VIAIESEREFGLSVMEQLDRANRGEGLPPNVVDQAKARGAFEGFTAAYAGGAFPVQGWWSATLAGNSLELRFHYLKLDGTLEAIYQVAYTPQRGWAPAKLGAKTTRSAAELVE